MDRSENVSIKTKYKTLEACEQNCVDGIGIKRIAKTGSNKLYGVFDESHQFTITSDARGAALFAFEGVILEKEDGIYLEGKIFVKPQTKNIVLGSILLFSLMGILFTLSQNAVLIFMGVLFMIVPWFNFMYMNKSNALYKMIENRVR